MTIKILNYYVQFLRRFRNGWSMIRALRGGPPVDVAVLWDGTRLVHPAGTDGMLVVLLDIWVDHCFTKGNFYKPADGDVIVDCGAHVGLFTTFIARENPRCRIVCLEPHPENFKFLQQNIAAACPSSATPLQLALGRRSGFGHIDDTHSARSVDHVFVLDQTANASAVPVVTLADLFELAKAPRIQLLKIDIEGFEHEAFAEVPSEVLDRFDRIAMEYHDNIRPGTLELVQNKIAATHTAKVFPAEMGTCGIMLATHKSLGSQP